LRGEIVGINTAIASQTGGYQGIGFAVPANLARDVQRQLEENGQVRRAYLGVSIQALTRDLSQQLVGRPGVGGVLVNGVKEDTPAEAAGLRRGDVITHFADQSVDSPSALQRAVERVPIGSTQHLRLIRFGKPLAVAVNTLEFRQEGLSRDLRGEQTKLAAPAYGNSLGFEVEDLADLARLRGVPLDVDAVVVTRVDRNGLAAEEGLRPGVIILQVRDREVQTVAQFRAAIRNQSLREGVLFLVRDTRDGTDRFVVLKSRS
jgi:serine protease Do